MIEQALMLFKAVAEDGGERALADIAAGKGVPLSSAQRWMGMFERQGLLVQSGRGRRIAGMGLMRIAGGLDFERVLSAAARPLLRRFARTHRTTVHLGIWDGEMVTYLVKESIGPKVFTREGMKLEGYCSAIGKILLAHLPPEDRQDYMSGESFVALTNRTIVDPRKFDTELRTILRQGFAIDDHEIHDRLMCCAVPVHDADGQVCAAISRSIVTTPGRAVGSAIQEDLFTLSRDLSATVFRRAEA